MKRFFIIILWLLLTYNAWSQVYKDTLNFYVFGMSLMVNFNSFGQYYLLYQPSDTDAVKYTVNISRDDFIWQAMGARESEANLKKENFFKKYNICPEQESNQDCYYRMRVVLANIWRLRYKTYPYDYDSLYTDHNGWAGKCCSPSYKQMQFLKQNYNIDEKYYLIKGKYLFFLLRDMQNRQWIEQYKKLANDDN